LGNRKTIVDEDVVTLIQSGVDVEHNMNLLWKQCRGYLYWVAKKYPTNSVADIEDYVQEGYLGLLKAIEDYKKVDGVEFLTYAQYHVKDRMYWFAQKSRYTLTVSEHIIEQMSKYNKGGAVSPAHENTIKNLDSFSLDDIVPGTDDGVFADFIEDNVNVEETVIDDVFRSQCRTIIWGCVGQLTPKQAEVIVERYRDNKTVDEVSASHRVSKKAVYSLERKALALLWEKDEIQALRVEYDYYNAGMKRTGFAAWKETGESSVERAIFRKIELENKRNNKLEYIEQKLNQLNHEKQELLETMFQRPIDEIIPGVLNLPERARDVFVLRTVDGMRNKDVANRFNTAAANANKSYSLAISKLKEAFAMC
jgi:RNA polymerase primary sigma factor